MVFGPLQVPLLVGPLLAERHLRVVAEAVTLACFDLADLPSSLWSFSFYFSRIPFRTRFVTVISPEYKVCSSSCFKSAY